MRTAGLAAGWAAGRATVARADAFAADLLIRADGRVRLSRNGVLLSNEVFSALL